ncbi:unnamed protein product [Periconia digitata]|uniref:Uncharacterized protein n=1 Tax=Periconia digitata TaxID=1303443 RepID=A0A9W4U3B2_9PLEO|nr:unnamed protein product [Periconia digitata]
MKEMDVYRKWFADNVMKEGEGTMSDAIMIMPVSCYAPDYRDTIHGPPGSISSFSEGYTASILRLPQFVVPVKYESRVSGRSEYHPITVGLVGASGSDTMLVELTKQVLKYADRPTVLLTGRNTWEPGNNVRNVGPDPKL